MMVMAPVLMLLLLLLLVIGPAHDALVRGPVVPGKAQRRRAVAVLGNPVGRLGRVPRQRAHSKQFRRHIDPDHVAQTTVETVRLAPEPWELLDVRRNRGFVFAAQEKRRHKRLQFHHFRAVCRLIVASHAFHDDRSREVAEIHGRKRIVALAIEPGDVATRLFGDGRRFGVVFFMRRRRAWIVRRRGRFVATNRTRWRFATWTCRIIIGILVVIIMGCCCRRGRRHSRNPTEIRFVCFFNQVRGNGLCNDKI